MIYFGIYFTLPLLISNFKDISSNYLIYYLMLLFYVIITWTSNDDKCWWTVKQNELLGIDTNYGFFDFIATITDTYPKTGNKESSLRDKLYWYYVYSSIGITCFMLYLKTKNISKN